MLLPDEDSIVLDDEDNGDLVVSDSDAPVPVWDARKMLDVLPKFLRRGSLPLRDAVVRAIGHSVNLGWASWSRLMQAQSSPAYADGTWLSWWGRRLRRPVAIDETEPQYRARLAVEIDRVSPPAIENGGNAIITSDAPLTPLVFIEPATDAVFVGAPTLSWQAYVQGSGARLWATYPGGYSGPASGGYLTGDVEAPLFWVGVGADVADQSMAPTVGDAGVSPAIGVSVAVTCHAGSEIVTRGFGSPAFLSSWTGGTLLVGTHAYLIVSVPSSDKLTLAMPVAVADDGTHAGVVAFLSYLNHADAWSSAFVASTKPALLDRLIADIQSRRALGVPFVLFLDSLIAQAK